MKIESKRLIFKKITKEDSEELFKIFSDKDLTKYFVSGADIKLEQTKKRVERIVCHWDKNKFGDFIIFDKKSLGTVGFGGLHYKKEGENINISYIVNKGYWGKDLGYEIAETLIDWGFNTLGLKKIVAEIDPDNIVSVNLVEKYGFKYNEKIEYKGFERLEYVRVSL